MSFFHVLTAPSHTRSRLITPLTRHFPLVLIVTGIIVRLIWTTTVPIESQLIGEANNVAISFAKTGTIADAFRVGQGPTAHVMPLAPIIAGAVYRLFGTHSMAAGLLLSLWSLSLIAIAWVMLYRSFEILEMPRATRIGVLAFLTLIPLNVSLEAVQFRVWEGGLGVAFAYTFLYRVLRLDRSSTITNQQFISLGLHAAATLIISPPLGVATFCCGMLLMARRTEAKRWLTIIGAVAAVSIGTVAPWTIRNVVVMHAPIVLRDNFGLELALAYYPGADAPGDPLTKFKARHYAIHPYQPKGNAAMIRAGGEVAYANSLGKEAAAYISAHPAAFYSLTLRHLSDFLFPPAWEWSQFGRTGMGTTVKLTLNWLITVLGLGGLVYGYTNISKRYIYVSVMTLIPVLPYMFVQPTLRYHYLIVNLIVFAAAVPIAIVARNLGKLRTRTS